MCVREHCERCAVAVNATLLNTKRLRTLFFFRSVCETQTKAFLYLDVPTK